MATHLQTGHKKQSKSSSTRTKTRRARAGQTNPKNNRKPVHQKVLLHAARTVPTPEIFNEVPAEMPFSTDKQ